MPCQNPVVQRDGLRSWSLSVITKSLWRGPMTASDPGRRPPLHSAPGRLAWLSLVDDFFLSFSFPCRCPLDHHLRGCQAWAGQWLVFRFTPSGADRRLQRKPHPFSRLCSVSFVSNLYRCTMHTHYEYSVQMYCTQLILCPLPSSLCIRSTHALSVPPTRINTTHHAAGTCQV